MPRIPQGQFNTTPSSRVGGPNLRQLDNSATNMAKSAGVMADAMAKLQDQAERTEAYSRANDVKRTYEQQKLQYETALQHADADGNFEYINPMDNNPDVTKREVVRGNIADAYQNLKSVYEEGRSNIKGIAREDIASDLMHQYVGDDLVRTQIRTNKHMIKVKGDRVMGDALKNIELKFNGVMEKVDENASAEAINLEIMKIENGMARELGTVSPVVGKEGTEKLAQYKDKMYEKYSKEVIKGGLTQASVEAADRMIAGIKDPIRQRLAERSLERSKKAVTAANEKTLINARKDILAQINSSGVMDEKMQMQALSMVGQLKNMYIDPRYSSLEREEVDGLAAELAVTVAAKSQIQENYDSDLTFIDQGHREQADIPFRDGMRGVASSSMEAEERMVGEIEQTLKQAGIDVPQLDIKSLAKQKMKEAYSNMKNNVVEMVRQKNPELQGRALYDKVALVSEAQGFGDVPLASPKQSSAFLKDFKRLRAMDASEAFNYFNEQMATTGASFEGEDSYARALAIDLVGKDEANAFLIAAADAGMEDRARMIENASRFDSIASEYDLSKDVVEDAFLATGARSEMNALATTSFYRGMKQAIIHEAASIYAESNPGGGKVNAGKLEDAFAQAREKMSEQYTIVQTRDGRTSVVALNREGGLNYNEMRTELEHGIEKAMTLDGMDAQTKGEIIERYLQPGLVVSANGRYTTPEKDMDFYLKKSLTLQPSARWPNEMTLHANGQPVTDRDGNVIRFSARKLVEMGTQALEEGSTDRQAQYSKSHPMYAAWEKSKK